MTQSIEDRVRAHFADRAARENVPGPEADTAVQQALQAGGRQRPPAIGWWYGPRRHLVLAAAAAVVIVAAVGGAVALRDDEPTVVTDDPTPTTTTRPRRAPTTTSPPTSSPTSTSAPSAPHPPAGEPTPESVIVSAHAVLGTWSGSAWVPWDATATPNDADEYQVVRLDEPITTAVGSVEVSCDVSGEVLTLDLGLRSGTAPSAPPPIAVTGVADPRPRAVDVLDPATSTYRDLAVEVLAGLGITDADPGISQVLRGDLDGDGTDEVVVVAERVADPAGPYGAAGDYSVAFLRQVVDGEVRTTVINSSIAESRLGDSRDYYIEVLRVAAFADLNGDGRMEIVLVDTYYEGQATIVYELQTAGAVTEVLRGGCGA